MKYFDDFDKQNENFTQGIISISPNYDKANIIKNDEILNIYGKENINRVFNNDLVSFKENNGTIQIVNQIKSDIYEKKIIGVLYVKSKTIIGCNKKGVPIYIFRPFDNSLPNFYVSSSYTKKYNPKRNIYAMIKFHKWETDCLYPSGICEEVFGEIGNIDIEKNLIFKIHNLDSSNYKNKYIKELIDYVDDEKNFIETDKNRLDLTEKNVFSIDPKDCLDIDDAVHIEREKFGYRIGIHIADVTAIIKEDSDIDNQARERTSTLYFHKRIDMIPSQLSTEICSLKKGEKKRAVSILFDINEDGKIIKIDYTRSFIKSKKSFSYEEANNILEKKIIIKELSDDLLLLKKIVSKFAYEYISIDQELDSHSLIEALMILTNCSVANILNKKYQNNNILRIHDGLDIERWNNISELTKNLDENLLRNIKILFTNSAKYEISSNIDLEKEILHIGLNKKFYTHFTSPIRRYIDIIIHRMLLSNKNYKEELLKNICEKVNLSQKKIKKAERDYEKLCLLEQLKKKDEFNENIIVDEKAIIIDINLDSITIYFPSYKMTHRMKLFSKKLNNLLNYNIIDKSIIINNEHTNMKLTLTTFQEITIKLTALPYSENMNNKIHVNIIDPDLFKILEFDH